MKRELTTAKPEAVPMKDQAQSDLFFRYLLVGIGGGLLTACSPSPEGEPAAKPLMKIAEPQREALDKAKETSQALEASAKQQQQVIEQASE